MVGITEKGPLLPVPVYNMTDYERVYGIRQSYAITAYDSAKLFFDEGGYKLYVGRVVGPGAVIASVMIPDNVAANTLQAKAKGPGDYGNDLNVVIRATGQDATIPAGYFRVRVQTDAAVILEESPDLLDDASAIYWSQTMSQYVDLLDQASLLDPTPGTYPLASGVLDQGSIVDASWQLGIDRLVPDLGPGQVFAPGRTTDVAHVQIKTHCEASIYKRVGLLDGADTATAATLTTSAAGCRSRQTGLFAPWLNTAGLTAGSSRLVPPSAGIAGLMARNDGLGHSPNEAAAGQLGQFRSVLRLTQTYTDADRELMNNAGVNIIREMFGKRVVYGYRTTTNPTTDTNWLSLGNARLNMGISSLANAVGERFVFRQIDGERKLIAEFGGTLIGEVLLPYFKLGSLFGPTPEDAFACDVGPNVNTAITMADNQLNAVLTMKMSPFGEKITIEIVKKLLTEEFV
jgi:hypothetical protein